MNQLFLVYYDFKYYIFYKHKKCIIINFFCNKRNHAYGLFSIMQMTSLIINKNKNIYLYKREGKGYTISLF